MKNKNSGGNVFGDEFWDKTILEKAKKELPFKLLSNIRNKRVIEMGCGVGWYIYLFSINHNKTTGIDIDKRRLDIARKILKREKVKTTLILGDVRDMPIKKESYDVVFCHGVIEHFKDSQKGVEEGYRILKKGGIAMYSVPARISFFTPLKIMQQLTDKIFKTRLWTCGYEKSFTAGKFKSMLINSGFKIKHFEISENESGRRFPMIGKLLKIMDKPFWWLGIGGRFMYALCEK